VCIKKVRNLRVNKSGARGSCLRTHDGQHLPGLDAEAHWVDESLVLQFLISQRDVAAAVIATIPTISKCSRKSALQTTITLVGCKLLTGRAELASIGLVSHAMELSAKKVVAGISSAVSLCDSC
jgi:hypothetical protein